MSFRAPGEIDSAVKALKDDLLGDLGPQISTVRNYNFAILPYAPTDEFAMRRAIHELAGELRAAGWNTGTVVLHTLLLARLRKEDPGLVEAMIQRERSLAKAADSTRGLRWLKERLVSLLDGPEGLSADVAARVEEILAASPKSNRTVVFLGRLGALYPFLRTSALLKQIAGRTHNVPVVLLYPGTVSGESGLSFMGMLPADRDYRPRIYR